MFLLGCWLDAAPLRAATCWEREVEGSPSRPLVMDCRGYGWGSAPLLVLVSPAGFSSSLMVWKEGGGLAQELADAGFRVLVVSPSLEEEGAGLLTGSEKWGIGLGGVPEAVEEALHMARGREVWVVGCGLSGTLLYSQRQAVPQGVTGMVVIGSPLPGGPGSLLFQEAAALLTSRSSPSHWSDLEGVPATFGAHAGLWDLLLHGTRPFPKVRRRALDSLTSLPPAALETMKALATEDGRGGGAEVGGSWALPLLAISGALDRLAPPEGGHLAALRAGPGSKAVRLGFMNGEGRDPGHLDLFATPRFVRRIADLIAEWRGKGREEP